MARRRLTLVVLSACLLAGGCGGSPEKTVTRADTTTVTPPATATATTPATAPSGVPTTPTPSASNQDAGARGAARKAVSELERCRRSAGTYEGCRGTGIPRNVEVADLTGDGYMVTAESQSGDTFTVTKSSSATTRTCSPPGSGGCPASGAW
jgi:hypothetical protein